MSAVKEKKFVMKHVFHDIMSMEAFKDYYGKEEIHYNVPWAICINKHADGFSLCLECRHTHETDDWSIETDIVMKRIEEDYPLEESDVVKSVFNVNWNVSDELDSLDFWDVHEYLFSGNLIVVCYVTITKTTGIVWKKLRSFDESMKEFSDTVLIVENEKFYVGKMYLASHSPYFKSLFMGNFDESKQSEITLNDINSYDFQNFLEVLHGEPAIDDECVDGILNLADMYDSKTAIRQCEEFLINKSERSLKEKFEIAIKYKLDMLRKKCIADIKTKKDIKSVFPKDVNTLQPHVWAELLEKSISLD